MILVIIESPFAGDTRRNIEYARLCVLDSLVRGEAPICSHLLYPQVLDDNLFAERAVGIAAGLAWLSHADKHVFYTDYGMSSGMYAAWQESVKQGFSDKIEKRTLGVV